MAKMVLLLFVAVFSLDFLNDVGLISRHVTLMPELVSLAAVFAIVFQAARNKYLSMNLGYIAIFSLLLLHIALGSALNSLSSGVLFAGIRDYFKYLPFFVLPLVYGFSEADLKRQLRLVLFFALAQLPVAAYQRFVESAGSRSGDLVGGTVGTSGHLSIFLLCVAAVWIAFQFRLRMLRPVIFLIVLMVLLLPTTLNETKGTVVLLPLALIAPALMDNRARSRTGRILVTGLALIGFMSAFIPIYDHFRGGDGIVSFYMNEEKVTEYLIRAESADAEKAGRIGGILIAADELSREPAKFVFGLGIGNTSRSFLGDLYSGEYSAELRGLGGATVAHLAWEIGWGGMILVAVLGWLIFRDALMVRTAEGVMGAVGLGWATVMLIVFVSMFYKDMINNNVLGYLFWYFSGIVAATANRMRAENVRWIEGKEVQMTSYSIGRRGTPIECHGCVR